VGSRPSIQVPTIDFSPTRPSQGGTNSNGLLAGNSAFDSATRALRLSTGAQVTLQPGTYNFCTVDISNNSQLIIPASGVVKIYLDSPASANSGCPAGSGRFWLHNTSMVNETAGNPANLDVYVRGTATDSVSAPDVLIENASRFRGSIVAPSSTVMLSNTVTLQAAIFAKNVIAENAITFTLPAVLKNRPQGSGGSYKPSSWFECKPRPAVATDPESGC
jgi:hypothetical protein